MATSSVSLQRNTWFRPKYVLFGFLALLLVYVLRHNESFLVNPQDPIWPHYRSIKWYLLPHGLAGACALLLGPMQFSDRLRRRFTKLHRVLGRLYVAGALIAAPYGAYIQYVNERRGDPRSFTFAGVAQATSWIVTTLIALALIRAGKVEQHRRWMTRSFSVALVFLEVRVVLGITGWESLGPSAAETVVWMCNIFALLAADVVLQVQELLRSGRPRSVAAAAAD